ncbi:uncharacterized protein DUF1657 [Orenia metallireducens]|jgi:hypothetical protein|uniref:DUF1657 domain-containing protein n=1 Tax=Orenia metallireducens TaxID=1413210 RepID=A0A285F316_9FIRM|nr:DUF1657 domain-containing protein [Orenia metallireducens]PRX34798.1 uncharacterized protein DUF1657 [Orenia metallireducens]SNY05665.1 Protein of unknown function [Orenia metallireducens]
MTVGQDLHKALNGLETARVTLEGFAQDTQDKMAQDMYNKHAQQVANVVNELRNRVNYVESQEPQFKVGQNEQNPQQ